MGEERYEIDWNKDDAHGKRPLDEDQSKRPVFEVVHREESVFVLRRIREALLDDGEGEKNATGDDEGGTGSILCPDIRLPRAVDFDTRSVPFLAVFYKSTISSCYML